jgi:probable phosphomutase (TIGR03848 family)
VAQRLAGVRLDAIVSSPIERCVQTAEAISAAQQVPDRPVQTDDRFTECGYGDWTGQPLRRLAREPLWRVVQEHPSAVTFPGADGEALAQVQRRAVAAVRDWNAKLGKQAVYLICSHGDVIKAILADSLGLHLDLYQRIQVDPCSLSVIRYTPLRPFVERLNDTGGSVRTLTRSDKAPAGAAALRPGDAPVGGGAGG